MNTFLAYLYKYKLSLICLVFIFILCFISIPRTELSSISFIDKWTHFVMFLGFCLILWLEYWLNHNLVFRKKLFLLIFLFPTIIGGSIELIQKYATNNRSGEYLDFFADFLGIIVALPIGFFVVRKFALYLKKDKDLCK